MKEFEKLWKINFLKGVIENEFLDRESVAFHSALQTWKAALEWALTTAFSDAFEDLHAWESGVSEEDKKVIAVTTIKKELND